MPELILSPIASKTCTKCMDGKPTSDFWALSSSKDGFAWHCKACAAKSSAAWRLANKDRLKASKAEYHAVNKERCNAQSKAWHLANLEYSTARNKEYRDAHAEELRVYAVEWRKRNLEKSRTSVTAYQALHPEMRKASRQNRRAKLRDAEGVITKFVVTRLLGLQRNKCAVCRSDVSSGYHIDHVYPLSKGGTNVIENLQILCPACNLSKSAKHPIDFMQSRGFLL